MRTGDEDLGYFPVRIRHLPPLSQPLTIEANGEAVRYSIGPFKTEDPAVLVSAPGIEEAWLTEYPPGVTWSDVARALSAIRAKNEGEISVWLE